MATRIGPTITESALFGDLAPVAVSEAAAGIPAIQVMNPPTPGNGQSATPASTFTMPTVASVFAPGFWRTDAAGVLYWAVLMLYLRRRLGSFARE